jgi:tetratricopeptide (TPR) repeat protein
MFALVGNLATNTVTVTWRWWPAAVWATAAVLLLGSLAIEAVRHRSAPEGTTHLGAVFGAIPRAAWHLQPRDQEESALRRALGGRGRAALVALPGQRGAGKTQLAAAHARKCVADGFDLVAWINSENGPASDLALLADRLGLAGQEESTEAAATAVCRWLNNQTQGRRLLVFDNVDDPDSLDGFLPATGTTKVIVTSNRQEFTTLGGITAVPIGVFTAAQGLDFLHRATGLSAAGATEIGEQLGWLPLGLSQAAATIQRDHLTYRQYLDALENEDLDETLRRRSGTDHPGVLKATQLGLARLGREDPTGDALQLLSVLALLAPEGISRALLAAGVPALSLSAGLIATLDRLATASLVTLAGPASRPGQDDNVLVAVHRLTARIVRHQAAKDAAAAAAVDHAVALLDKLTDDLPAAQLALRRAEMDELVAHIAAVRSHVEEPSSLLLTNCRWAGGALLAVGDLAHSLDVLQDVLADHERIHGPDHRDTLICRNNLAFAYRSADRFEEAIPLFQAVVADSTRVLGPANPDTLTSRDNLAGAYAMAGRVDESIALLRTTLADREGVLGPDHLDTLTSRSSLARAYEDAGRLDEAIELQETALADWQRVVGADHPEALTAQNNLAGSYESAGRLGEAIALFRLTLADRQRILGPDHPDTLMSRNDLAYTLGSASRTGEATRLFRSALADCERILGPGHPLTEAVRRNLADTLGRSGGAASARARLAGR